MSKWYEITVKSVKVFAVECDNEEEAFGVVRDTLFNDERDEMEAEELSDSDAESIMRHIDKDKIFPVIQS